MDRENNFSISPNPSSDYFTISFQGKTGFENAVLSIYNVHGKEVKQQNITSKATVISREGLRDGIYFYRIVGGGGESWSGKMVIERQ
jgi:hypothetical protein